VVVDDDPAGHRYEPGPQRRALLDVQLVGVAPGTHERLLNNVLRPVPVAPGKTEREGQQRPGVLGVQRSDQLIPVTRGPRRGLDGGHR
jgi:hypothetical protein